MRPGRLASALTQRIEVLVRYASAAPSLRAMASWMRLGAIRARLTGGEARLPPRQDAGARDALIPIGPLPQHRVRIDLSSLAELDGFEEIFVRRIYRLGELPFRPELIVDCGSNIGLFASLCRVTFPEARIFCWEPEPGNFARLKAQPLLQSDLVAVSPEAVSDADGWVSLLGGGLGGRVVENSDDGAQRVRARHLRPWLLQQRGKASLIKIDIEGHEERLIPSLAGAWPERCALFMETHQEAGKDAAILACLAGEGFQWVLQGTHAIPKDTRRFNEYFAARLGAAQFGDP